MATVGQLIVDIRAKVGNLRSGLTKAERSVKASTGKMNKSLSTLSGSATKLGGLFGTGLDLAAFAGVAKAAIRTMIDFNRTMSEVSALTGATGRDLAFIRQKALEFGRTTTVAARDVAEAFKLMASAKPDLLANVEALAATTREAITLRDAAGIELSDAIRTLGASLNQFSADADQANRFINVLAAGAKFGASEIADTANALRDSGTVAAAAGISFEELNASIQLLASISLKGSQAGTQLRNVILRLQKGADETNPKIVGLQQALLNLGKQSLSAGELMDLFGLESFVAAQQLIAQATALGVLTEKLTDTKTASEQAATNMDNLSGDVDKLGTAFSGLGIKIAEGTGGGLRQATQALEDFVNKLNDNFERMERFSENTKGFAPIIGPLLIALDLWAEANKGVSVSIPIVPLEEWFVIQERMRHSTGELAGKLFSLMTTLGLNGDQIEQFSGVLNQLRERFAAGIISVDEYGAGLQDLETDMKAVGDAASDAAIAQAKLEEAFDKATRALLPVKKAQADLNEFVDKFLDLAVRAGGQVLEDFRAGVNRLALKLVDAETAQAKFTEGQIKNIDGARVLKGVTEDLTDAFRESTDGIKLIKGVTVQHTGAVANLTSTTERLSSANERNAETVREIARAQDALSGSLINLAQSESLTRGILTGTGLGGSETLKFGKGAIVITSLGGLIAGAGKPISNNPTFGLKHGGSFKVGGVGGPDSQEIRLKATPGEILQAIPPGQGGGRGDTVITINQRFNVAPGADVDTFRRTLRQSNRMLVRALQDTG